jgi:hypothetical protein
MPASKVEPAAAERRGNFRVVGGRGALVGIDKYEFESVRVAFRYQNRSSGSQ